MKPTPMNLAREFAKGKWVNMLSEKCNVSEAHVEAQLMKAVEKLLGRTRGGTKGKL